MGFDFDLTALLAVGQFDKLLVGHTFQNLDFAFIRGVLKRDVQNPKAEQTAAQNPRRQDRNVRVHLAQYVPENTVLLLCDGLLDWIGSQRRICDNLFLTVERFNDLASCNIDALLNIVRYVLRLEPEFAVVRQRLTIVAL
ncbi:hypothetical protein D3C87_1757900 [compost metagenome]